MRDFFADKKRVAWLSVGSNTLLTAGKLAAGLATGSVSILSEAAHSAMDLLAACIATFSVHVADRPPDRTHPYGHEKVENVSGVIEGILIFLAALWIIYEGVEKLLYGVDLKHLGHGLVVMAVSAVVNLVVATLLKRSSEMNRSVALEADAAHLYTDVYTSVGVFVGLAAITLGKHVFDVELAWLDPACAIGVALLILSAAYRITKKSFMPLLDASASPGEFSAIEAAMAEFREHGVDCHEIRTRRAGASLHVDLHMGLWPGVSLEYGHRLSHELKDRIEKSVPGAKVLVHEEPADTIQVLADSDPAVQCLRQELLKDHRVCEVRSLAAKRYRGDLRVEAALLLEPAVTMAESRVLTHELKARLQSCFPEVKETVLSLHPADGWQSAIHEDDRKRIRDLVGEHQTRFAGIHALEIASSGGMHRVQIALGVPYALPVVEAHAVAHHIESDIRGLFPEGAEIQVHIEPCNETCQTCHAVCPARQQ